MTDLVHLLSQPPAALTFTASADGRRPIGTTVGFVLDIWPDRVEAAALFPPDQPDLAARNGVLFQLLLAATRPAWAGAEAWLVAQLRLAPTLARGQHRFDHIAQRVALIVDRAHSRATLRIVYATRPTNPPGA